MNKDDVVMMIMMMKGAVWLTNERKREGFREEEGGNMHIAHSGR